MVKMIIVYFFSVNLILMSQSAPVVMEEEIKWRENTLTPVWLPAAPIRNDQYPVDYNLLMKHKNEDKNDWESRSVYGSLPEIKSALPRQTGNRPPKKDSILSRSWGAGGLPFSVLYMNSRGSRIQPTADTKTTTRKPIENSSTVKIAQIAAMNQDDDNIQLYHNCLYPTAGIHLENRNQLSPNESLL